MSPFDSVRYLTVEKKPWSALTTNEQKAFTPFMVNRILSMNPELVELVNYIQLHSNIPLPQVYQLYSGFLPSQLDRYNYIKKSKDDANDALLKVLADAYRISQREVREYLHLIPKEKIKRLLHGKGYSEKEIKKMLK